MTKSANVLGNFGYFDHLFLYTELRIDSNCGIATARSETLVPYLAKSIVVSSKILRIEVVFLKHYFLIFHTFSTALFLHLLILCEVYETKPEN